MTMKSIGKSKLHSILDFDGETFRRRIWLLMKGLLQEKSDIQKLRFWGKIFGMKKNYYIVEADFETFDHLDLNDSEFVKYQQSLSVEQSEDEEDDDEKLTAESVGHGINRKIFFVSSGSKNSSR